MENRRCDIPDRLIKFAAEVIRLVEALPDTMTARKIADQLIRSVMSVGANFEEALGTNSTADFSHKLQIALKEMRESRYWLCLISELDMIPNRNVPAVLDEATQLRAILAKSVATSRGKSRKA